jgi:hypothetical protein
MFVYVVEGLQVHEQSYKSFLCHHEFYEGCMQNQYLLDCSVTLPAGLRYKWAPISFYQHVEDGHVATVS